MRQVRKGIFSSEADKSISMIQLNKPLVFRGLEYFPPKRSRTQFFSEKKIPRTGHITKMANIYYGKKFQKSSPPEPRRAA